MGVRVISNESPYLCASLGTLEQASGYHDTIDTSLTVHRPISLEYSGVRPTPPRREGSAPAGR